MKGAALSLKVFAIYVALVPGLGLVLFPVDLFALLGANIPGAEDIWAIRMIGYLAFALGVYYWYMGSLNLWRLYPITVIMRIGIACFMVILWLSGEADPSIIGFALIDFLGAVWTLITIRANKSPSAD
jgi:hypothetical protein